MSLIEVADALGVAPHYVYRLVAQRRLPYFKIGRLLRFEPDDIAAWLQSVRIESW